MKIVELNATLNVRVCRDIHETPDYNAIRAELHRLIDKSLLLPLSGAASRNTNEVVVDYEMRLVCDS